jgi:hypothetical protein
MSPEPAGIIQVCADRSHAWRFGLRACCTHLSHRCSSRFLVLIISFIRPQDSLSSLQANTLDSPRSTPTQRCTNLLKLFVFASETRTRVLVFLFTTSFLTPIVNERQFRSFLPSSRLSQLTAHLAMRTSTCYRRNSPPAQPPGDGMSKGRRHEKKATRKHFRRILLFFLQNYVKRAVRQDGSTLSVISREQARGNSSFAESPRCGNSSFAENTPEVRQLGF